jgi:hypothetical protein
MIERSEQIAELATALAKAQAQLGPAIKDKTNPAFKSRYADLTAVWDACRKPLSDNGLSVVQMPVDAEPGRVALTTILLHASGQYLSSTVSTRIVKDDPQGVGSALTYLRRYTLAACVGIVADEDDDGNHASQPSQPAAQPLRQPQTGSGASDKQMGMIKHLRHELQWSADQLRTFAASRHINLDDLSVAEASKLIEALQATRNGTMAEAAA